MSLTKEQWECLAVFAGADLLGEFGKDVRGDLYPIRLVGSFTNGWHPNSDWRDFGPLWMKLEQWKRDNVIFDGDDGAYTPTPVAGLVDEQLAAFYAAIDMCKEQELMQAGCELGAAIGKAMRGV